MDNGFEGLIKLTFVKIMNLIFKNVTVYNQTPETLGTIKPLLSEKVKIYNNNYLRIVIFYWTQEYVYRTEK